LQYEVRPNLPLLGPKYGAGVAEIRSALSAQDPAVVAAAIAQGQSVEIAGRQLEPDEILVSTVEQEGFASAEEGGYVVVVDTELSPELRDEGLARELVHRIQNLRRDAGFDISDRITTYWQGDDEVRRVLAMHAEYVQGETLSLSLVESEPPPEAHRSEQTVDGHEVVLGLVRGAV
jgi:isoleucyl-tRNA synthetase